MPSLVLYPVFYNTIGKSQNFDIQVTTVNRLKFNRRFTERNYQTNNNTNKNEYFTF